MASKRAPTPKLDFARWILWEDDVLVAVDKPAGVLSQGGERGEGVNVVDLARAHLGLSGVGVLHRIDRNVSGIVLVAKHHAIASAMTKLFARGDVERVYRAVVRGSPPSDAFVMDAWLAKDPVKNEVRAAKASAPKSTDFKPARTIAQVVDRFRAPLGTCASLDVRPITGRSHQIRVHLADVGLPIIGDPKYGVPANGLNRPLLHATRIAFRHPKTRAPIVIESALPWKDVDLRTLAPVTSRHTGSPSRTPARRPGGRR
jgi:23S rRNA pseudouridine1911/1915/1917 synthase